MKKCILCLLFVLLLAGCGTQQSETVVPTTTVPTVDIGGTVLTLETDRLDLTELAWEYQALLDAAPQLPAVTVVDLGVTDLTAWELDGLKAAFPQSEIRYSVDVLGKRVSHDTISLDLSTMDAARTDELVAVLPMLPNLQEINFANGEGCVYDLDNIRQLDKVREAAPQATLRVKFELFGQTVTSEDERIEYYLTPIGNEGAETVRAVLPYLKNCTYFLMDGCDIDYEILAKMRDDFPQTKIVWRIWLAGPFYGSERLTLRASMLSDTKLIRTVVVTDRNCHLLNYCTETKYMDLGHNDYISDCSFINYMPDLEVAILGLTEIADISPLANCPKLEYLELFSCKVSDLSPLANCTELRHLNVSNLKGLTDLTPLYGLKNLERFRAVMNPQLSKAQLDELAAQLPNCNMLREGWDPTENGWRWDEDRNPLPRYALLKEQMEYDLWEHN